MTISLHDMLRAAQYRLAADMAQRIEVRLGLDSQGRIEPRVLRPGAPAWEGIVTAWPDGLGAPEPDGLLIEAEPLSGCSPPRARDLADRPGLFVEGHLFAITVMWLTEVDGNAVRVLGPDGPIYLPAPAAPEALPPLALWSWSSDAGWWGLPSVEELSR
jgi:hypothetical protein